jgi:hypothetical protein
LPPGGRERPFSNYPIHFIGTRDREASDLLARRRVHGEKSVCGHGVILMQRRFSHNSNDLVP